MTTNEFIETEGATVEQAIREALSRLGAEEADVSIEVLTTPRSGLLGLGSRNARVRVTRHPPEPARSEVASPPPAHVRPETVSVRIATTEMVITGTREETSEPPRGEASRAEEVEFEPVREPRRRTTEPGLETGRHRMSEEEHPESGSERHSASLDEQCKEALRLVEQILDLMGEQAEAVLGESDAESVHIDIKGDGSGILIGRHGQTLDALEYLVNRLVARRIKDAAPITLDVAAYRARRSQQLERMALSMGERAKRERKTVALEPMAPRDRRIVHLTLKDDPLVSTRSVGTGYLRALEIVPTDAKREGEERNQQRNRHKREAPGQQGGFKHGQKRIV